MDQRAKVSINDYPVTTGTPGLCGQSWMQWVPTRASPRLASPALCLFPMRPGAIAHSPGREAALAVMSDSSDPMDCGLPGSSIHGILQARVLEWGAIAFLVPHTQLE